MAPAVADVAELLVASGARDPRLVAIGAAVALRHVVGDPARLPADQRGVVAALEHWARGTGDRDALIVVGERLAAPIPLPLRIVRELARVDGPARAVELDALCAVAALMLWSQTPGGRAWHAAHPRPTPAQVHADPVAAQGIAAQRAKLAATIREIIDGDHATAAARFAAWLARDRAAPREQKPARDRTPLGDQIIAHVAKRIGAVRRTYRDRDAGTSPTAPTSASASATSGAIQIDVHVVAPRRGDRVVLVTSGMAERPLALTADDGTRATVYTELVMSLPAGWLHGDDDLRDPRWFWPFAWLRFLGRRPHDKGTALRAGEVVGPLQPPGAPRATRFDAVLLAESALVPDLAANRTVTFLDVCPLYAAEFALARSHGRAELLGRFAGEGCDPAIVDPARASVA